MNCLAVLDIGSGVGHLSRRLAYGHGLSVCCVERQHSLSKQAEQLDLQIEATLCKHLSNKEMRRLKRPVHLTLSLDQETNDEDLIESVKAALQLEPGSKDCFGIVGLHTCGDLAPRLLRLLVHSPSVVFINVVGCCFMKLTTDKGSGYPMSDFLRSGSLPHDLSYEAREVACHANEMHCQRLQRGPCLDLKVHCYRATLQEILSRRWPHLIDSNIASVKCTPQMSFKEYCDIALSKLGVHMTAKDVTMPETLQNLCEWKRVVTVGSLRLLLAPLVETIILLDRLLYVREQGLESSLLPIFDPFLSPRNHVLTAMKR